MASVAAATRLPQSVENCWMNNCIPTGSVIEALRAQENICDEKLVIRKEKRKN